MRAAPRAGPRLPRARVARLEVAERASRNAVDAALVLVQVDLRADDARSAQQLGEALVRARGGSPHRDPPRAVDHRPRARLRRPGEAHAHRCGVLGQRLGRQQEEPAPCDLLERRLDPHAGGAQQRREVHLRALVALPSRRSSHHEVGDDR